MESTQMGSPSQSSDRPKHPVNMTGRFVISLDFELMWGVHDKKTIQTYGSNIEKVQIIIPRLLEMFKAYGVKSTFSTVGLLFSQSKEELIAACPKQKPSYTNPLLSPYTREINHIGLDVKEDLYHYAPGLIAQIKNSPDQEIGTHTFSHYYCLESGQTQSEFKEDLQAAIKIAQKNNCSVTSIVFPRNQCNEEYLKICQDLNIDSYRGNEPFWAYAVDNEHTKNQILLKRLFRLLDSYITISGNNTYNLDKLRDKTAGIQNIPASRFLRPYSTSLSFMEGLKRRRIKRSMTRAAKHREMFHLWWHPHNFGSNTDLNFAGLEDILKHYTKLNKNYGFESASMESLTAELAGKSESINQMLK